MTASTRAPLGARIAWPTAAFSGMLAGVLGSAGAWWGVGFLLVPLVAWRTGGRPWLLAVTLIAALVGAARHEAHEARPDVLAPWQGATVTLSGRWDGRFLTLRDPEARVALSPTPTLAPGQLVVRGRLDRPAGRRNPGGFDYAAWLDVQGVRQVLFGAQVRRHTPAGGAYDWFRRGVRAGLGPREGALLEAIELGDRRAVEGQDVRTGLSVRDAFERAGLAHLMALSGQNVALLVGAVTFVLIRTPLGRWRHPLLLLMLVGYVGLVGTSPSVVRAVWQGALVLLALWAGRGALTPLESVSLAGVLSLLPFPTWVFDVGFQLSFLAVLGLLLTSRLESRLPRRWPRAARLAVAATLLAEFATLPLVAHAFGSVPLVGLVSNLVVMPVMTALVPLGFLAGMLGPLAAPLNVLTGALARLLLWLVGLFGSVTPLPWGQVSAAGFVAYGLFALAVVAWLWRRLRGRHVLLVALVCAAVTALPGQLAPPREVVFLDVGQGDATLVRLGGFTALIDGGGTPRGDFDVGAETVVPALHALGVFDLDLVIATHADSDHVEGLASVVRLMRVGEVWIGHRKDDDPLVAALLDAARSRRVPVREVRRGDRVDVPGGSLRVLWPRGAPWAHEDNENSVALRLDVGAWRAAFLGDLSTELEAGLGVGRLDLLKVAHHGSRFSTGDALLRESAPKDAVVSVGRNTYGHPNGAVLERLRTFGVRIWRTDEVGALRWPVP